MFEKLLTHHPNHPFVDSVLTRLCEGFCPFADMTKDGYLKSWDGSCQPPKMEKEWDFLKEQVEVEIVAGHFSGSFGTELLLSMYSLLIHAVPKPELDML